MAARKLANEVERCFKKVAEGVAAFETIYEKIQQASNPSQKEKLEDALKKEIKKLQKSRDQIKAWAATNDIKDKKPLLEQRKLIETQMEKFKAVEKEMKTKAYSKEGLSAASKLDPKEKIKLEMCQFLSNMVEELKRQIETVEAEAESLLVNLKKGRKDIAKADRKLELERITERHKWHQGKLELLLRSLENDGLESEQVKELEESIVNYVENNQNPDFFEDDTMYNGLNLTEEEDLYGMANEVDRVSSQDAHSIQDDAPDGEFRAQTRRQSTQLKSPLPALATLHATLPTVSSGLTSHMKPAPLAIRASGEPLKYASAAAAAAAAASDKNSVGIAPLPPPPIITSVASPATGILPLPLSTGRPNASSSPSISNPHSVTTHAQVPTKSPVLSQPNAAAPNVEANNVPDISALENRDSIAGSKLRKGVEHDKRHECELQASEQAAGNNDVRFRTIEQDSVYHLPSSLQDLLDTLEATKSEIVTVSNTDYDQRISASFSTCPESVDAERPRHYKPQNPYPYTPSHYPQEQLQIFDDPRLYARVDTDSLFYSFYYRQGTYQQYLAAKALKSQSWRFHKQYQTWFQRHEEPKSITEDYEQGTYRFFDYESTWMNRRKADFRFAYKFLEDDL